MKYYTNNNEVYAYEDEYVPSNKSLVRMTEQEVSEHLNAQVVHIDPTDVVRRNRDKLLNESIDNLSPVYWEAINTAKKDEWIKYRQALLDITNQNGFPSNVVWPIKPER